MTEAAALQPAPDDGVDDGDLLLRLADILAPRAAYGPEDMERQLLPLALRRT